MHNTAVPPMRYIEDILGKWAQNDTYQQSNFLSEDNWQLAEELIACPI